MIILASCLQSWTAKTSWLLSNVGILYIQEDEPDKKFVSYISNSFTSAGLACNLFVSVFWKKKSKWEEVSDLPACYDDLATRMGAHHEKQGREI